MKLTTEQLKKIIKEEIEAISSEQPLDEFIGKAIKGFKAGRDLKKAAAKKAGQADNQAKAAIAKMTSQLAKAYFDGNEERAKGAIMAHLKGDSGALSGTMQEDATQMTDAELTAKGKVENALKDIGASPLDISYIARPKTKAGGYEDVTLVKVKGKVVAQVLPDGRISVVNFPQLQNKLKEA